MLATSAYVLFYEITKQSRDELLARNVASHFFFLPSSIGSVPVPVPTVPYLQCLPVLCHMVKSQMFNWYGIWSGRTNGQRPSVNLIIYPTFLFAFMIWLGNLRYRPARKSSAENLVGPQLPSTYSRPGTPVVPPAVAAAAASRPPPSPLQPAAQHGNLPRLIQVRYLPVGTYCVCPVLLDTCIIQDGGSSES